MIKYCNYQVNNKTEDEINKFLEFLLTNISDKKIFLDIGCGTGIYTEKLYKNFIKTLGIDPSESMIKKCKHLNNVKFKCLYLNETNYDTYNLITAFSQIINHLTSISMLEEFIRDLSIRLEDDGIFYFDIFNYDFFLNNEPINEERKLSETEKYCIFPTIISKNDYCINLDLNNKIINNTDTYPYTLSMYIWKLEVIEKLLNKYNINIIEKCKMFDNSFKNLLECSKISIICKKKYISDNFLINTACEAYSTGWVEECNNSNTIIASVREQLHEDILQSAFFLDKVNEFWPNVKKIESND